MSEAVNMLGIEPPHNLPDHSILSGTFVTSFYDFGRNYEDANQSSNQTEIPTNQKKKLKKNLGKMDQTFFMSNDTLNIILFTIHKLENKANNKNEIDKLWLEVKNIFLSEMDSLPDIPASNSKKQNRKFKKSKSFWNPELEKLWNDACRAEKQYLNFKVCSNKDNPKKNHLRTNFKSLQKLFDKKYRYFQRQHKKKEYHELESNAKSKPAAMWEQLKRLDNPKTAKAALEIVREDKTISRDLKEILERWFKYISKLFFN